MKKILLLALPLAIAVMPPAERLLAAGHELPPTSLKIHGMAPEQSLSTYIPSEAAPGQGLAVNVIYPQKPRYKDGAPVVVVVPGANQPNGLDFSMHAAQQGFIEVRFAFPGGGKKGFSSSGIYDLRGVHSQKALRDVIAYAAGKIADHQGKTINELLPVAVYNKNVGVTGWSNGGNTLLVTLAKYGTELPFVSWIAFYESPIGAMFFPPALGGAHDLLTLRHYRQGTAATGHIIVDYKKIAYQMNGAKQPGSHKKAGEPEIAGVLYFDENQNGHWEETSEFAVTYAADIGFDKQIYPPAMLKALQKKGLRYKLPKSEKIQIVKPVDTATGKTGDDTLPWPPQLATPEEAEAFFRERDGSLYLKDVLKHLPGLAITVVGTKLDHLQRQHDHPHIAMLYNALLDERPKFVRLNPDPFYVGAVSGLRHSVFADNKPNHPIESDEIAPHLEPEGLIPDYAYMEATIAELADRTKAGLLNKELTAPIVNYSNDVKPAASPSGKQ